MLKKKWVGRPQELFISKENLVARTEMMARVDLQTKATEFSSADVQLCPESVDRSTWHRHFEWSQV